MSRSEVVASAFENLLAYEDSLSHLTGSVCSSAVADAVTPEMFIVGASCVTPMLYQTSQELQSLKADIAAEFLLDEDVVTRGTTRELAVACFEAKKATRCLKRPDWEYFFGTDPSGDVSNIDRQRFARSRMLLSSALEGLRLCLSSRLTVYSDVAKLFENQESARRTIIDSENVARMELASSFRRQLYASSLRQRLEEDRLLVVKESAVRAVDAQAQKDSAEIQRLRWEQEAVSRSIEANRSAAMRLEYAIQSTDAAVRHIGNELPVARQWKEKVVQLAVHEVRDEHQAMWRFVTERHRATEDRLSAVEDKLLEVGRVLVLNSACMSRSRHDTALSALGPHGDLSWLMPLQSEALEDHNNEDSEVEFAKLMLNDRLLFVAPERDGARRAAAGCNWTHVTDACRKIITEAFAELRTGRTRGDDDVSVAPVGDGITIAAFVSFLSETGLLKLMPVPRLEFDAFSTPSASAEESTLRLEGWLSFLYTASGLTFPDFARQLSANVVLQVFCERVLSRWLRECKARVTNDSKAVRPHDGSHSSPEALRDLDPCVSGAFDFVALTTEGLGALCAEGYTADDFLAKFVSEVAEDRASAPISLGARKLAVSAQSLCECSAGCDALLTASPDSHYNAGFAPWALAVSNACKRSGDTALCGSVDACAAWLSCCCDDCAPPRQVLTMLLCDIVVRIAQQSLHRDGVALRHWSRESTSRLLFDAVVPAALQMSTDGIVNHLADAITSGAMAQIETSPLPAPLFFAAVVVVSHCMPLQCPLDFVFAKMCQ